MRSLQTHFVSLLCALWISGCGTGEKTGSVEPAQATADLQVPSLSKGWVLVQTEDGEERIRVELARSHEERSRGLMYRKELPSGKGMLFIFEREHDQTFWMKNTWIPLDMVFIRRDLTIAGIVHEAKPHTLTQRSIGKPSLYVLEVPGGWAKERGLKAGQRVKFEGVDQTSSSVSH